jgi:adenine phosphoribosyltransferase
MILQEELIERQEKDSGYLITAYPRLYKKVISEMIEPFVGKKFSKVMSPEMRGILFGPTIAYKMNLPFVIIVKGERIPSEFVIGKDFMDYTKKKKRLEIAKITINKGDKVLLVDDTLESGASARTIIKLIEKLGGKVTGISIVYNKLNKKNEEFFKKYNLHYLVKLR